MAAKALASVDVSLEAVREKVEETVGPAWSLTIGSPPFTPRAKKVLELSLREALQLGHDYIGTEHILLGLIREGEGVAAQVMISLGAELPRVRQQVIQLLAEYSGAPGADVTIESKNVPRADLTTASDLDVPTMNVPRYRRPERPPWPTLSRVEHGIAFFGPRVPGRWRRRTPGGRRHYAQLLEQHLSGIDERAENGLERRAAVLLVLRRYQQPWWRRIRRSHDPRPSRADRVLSPGGWLTPPGVMPGWNWLPTDGASPRLDLLPLWVRAWYRIPLIDRYAHVYMWHHGAWETASPDQAP